MSTLKELRARASELKIKGRSSMNKAELEAMIAHAEGRNVPPTVEYQFAVELPLRKPVEGEEDLKAAIAGGVAAAQAGASKRELDRWARKIADLSSLVPESPARRKSKRAARRRRARIQKRGF